MDLDSDFYHLGDWLLDCQAQTVNRDNKTNKLPDKAFQVLLILIREQGMTVSKHDLIEEVWPGSDDSAEKSLANAIWQLRTSLSDSNDVDEQEEQPQVIKTVPKLGYQLTLEAEPVLVQPERTQPKHVGKFAQLYRRHRMSFIVFSFFAVLFVIAQVMQA